MNSLELIRVLQKENGLSRKEADTLVKLFFNEMSDALARGDRIEIRGLCSFYIKEYKAYVGRNPKTGGKVQVKPKKLPFFKPGKPLKDRVNNTN